MQKLIIMGKKNKKKECFSENEQEFIDWLKQVSMNRGDDVEKVEVKYFYNGVEIEPYDFSIKGSLEFFCNEELHKALGLEAPEEPEYVYIVDYWDDNGDDVCTQTFGFEHEAINFLRTLDEDDILCVQRAVIDKYYEVQIKKEIKLIDAEE